jgi:hypothetical protein
MITRASGLGIGVGWSSRSLRGVGVIEMPIAGLGTMQRVELPPGAGVVRLLETGMAVGVYIDGRSVADWVEVTR